MDFEVSLSFSNYLFNAFNVCKKSIAQEGEDYRTYGIDENFIYDTIMPECVILSRSAFATTEMVNLQKAAYKQCKLLYDKAKKTSPVAAQSLLPGFVATKVTINASVELLNVLTAYLETHHAQEFTDNQIDFGSKMLTAFKTQKETPKELIDRLDSMVEGMLLPF